MKLISKVTAFYCIAYVFCKEYELELSVESISECKITIFFCTILFGESQN